MKAILHLLEYDFRRFLRYRWWILGLISMNLADLFIMAMVFTKMVNPNIILNYFRFFSPGITITASFAAAFTIGREINWEVRRNFSHYMLSLPMTRRELASGRMLSGGLRGMIYMFSPPPNHVHFPRVPIAVAAPHHPRSHVSSGRWNIWPKHRHRRFHQEL